MALPLWSDGLLSEAMINLLSFLIDPLVAYCIVQQFFPLVQELKLVALRFPVGWFYRQVVARITKLILFEQFRKL